MVRALLDANVLISFLLSTRSESAPVIVVESALSGSYQLLLPRQTVDEFYDRTTRKPYLVARITPDEASRLIEALITVTGGVESLPEPFPPRGPDRDDDYLFEYAIVGRADYLVSGDRDVLAVGQIGDVRIVSPAAFVEILRAAGRI